MLAEDNASIVTSASTSKDPSSKRPAAEIVHASWRLRRCDPLANPAFARTQETVDRARAQSHGNLYRAKAELRRLQTECQVRVECLPEDFGTSHPGGLASIKNLESILAFDLRRQLLNPKLGTPAAKRTQSSPPDAAQIAPSHPCPCGSGAKYRRCCGRNAPGLSPIALKSVA